MKKPMQRYAFYFMLYNIYAEIFYGLTFIKTEAHLMGSRFNFETNIFKFLIHLGACNDRE